jgi:hypothetical protein
MFYNEKHEKESRIKDLQVYKEAETVSEVKELKAKYENLK